MTLQFFLFFFSANWHDNRVNRQTDNSDLSYDPLHMNKDGYRFAEILFRIFFSFQKNKKRHKSIKKKKKEKMYIEEETNHFSMKKRLR